MDTVILCHPGLPGVQITVARVSAGVYLEVGWKVASKPKPPPTPVYDMVIPEPADYEEDK